MVVADPLPSLCRVVYPANPLKTMWMSGGLPIIYQRTGLSTRLCYLQVLTRLRLETQYARLFTLP